MSQNIKKNILLFVILSFMTSSIYGQSETITSKVIKKDENGYTLERVFYDGKNKEIAHLYFDSEGNQIKIEGKIPDGVVVKSFYDNGNLQRESVYKDNKFNGIVKDYYKNGKLESETFFKNDKREGITKEYYESGKLKAEYNDKNDKQNGITKTYYESGNLKSQYNFKDGEQEGVEKHYYENGNLNAEFNYIDGKKDGIAKIYYESGKLQGECNFKNDKLEGVFKEYYENGSLKSESNFKDGKQEGIEKNYDENGVLEDKVDIVIKNVKEVPAEFDSDSMKIIAIDVFIDNTQNPNTLLFNETFNYGFELQDEQGYIYKPESYESEDIVKPNFGTDNIFSGDVKRGWVNFRIPKNINIKELKLRYKSDNVKSNWMLLSDIKPN